MRRITTIGLRWRAARDLETLVSDYPNNDYTANSDNSDNSASYADIAAPQQQQQQSSTRSRPRVTAHRRLWKDIIEILFLVITIYTGVNLATARAIVEGNSMQPNFQTGQLIIVNRFAYFFNRPKRGDVVVLHNPAERCIDAAKNRSLISLPFINSGDTVGCEDLIKRVMGLPGETIQIIGGFVYINGTKLDEPYIAAENFCDTGCDRSFQLGDDEYLVLGDNRSHSYDGHSFGPIKKSLIVGQAWVRYWPLDQATVIEHPSYGVISTTPIQLPTATPSFTPAATLSPNDLPGSQT
ncbi:MAG: signal peptidase I, partial [Anaerolineae bacterium]|nr:signal peptidase I [Anaerolineae bacterium]